MQNEAIAEDPSIFQYDEVFDDLQKKKSEAKIAKKSQEAKKPKYINKLLDMAEKRKKDYERRIERQVQKEREAEGEEFKDKESFVTSSYRQKLEEIKAAEEVEKREEYLEKIGDVRKQSDLSGFYRHLYSQQVGNEKVEAEIKEDEEKNSGPIKDEKIKKNYRKRKSSKDEHQEKIVEDADAEKETHTHLPSNLDADSDFEIESSDEDEKNDKKKTKISEVEEKTVKLEPAVESNDVSEKNTQPDLPDLEIKEKIEKLIVVKIDIWKKRTVGGILEQALQRYYERKAMKEQSI